jgi:ATP-dependent Clp protease ATP-binding subunit ClpB
VRQRPYSVLLFDEVEKAHHDVFNLLLQVLDDGRLTDGRGRLADFTNCVVIMTSNITTDTPAAVPTIVSEASEASGLEPDGESGVEELPPDVQRALERFFRPEFLNRIGDIVRFGALTRQHLHGIIDIQLERLGKLLESRGLSLSVSDAAKSRLVELGYEPAFGARPLERTLVRQIQDPVAEGLLGGRFKSGDTLRVDVASERIVLTSGVA